MFAEDTITMGEPLMMHITEERRRKWQEMIEQSDCMHNSKKAWATIHKLSRDTTKEYTLHKDVTANQIAHQLILNELVCYLVWCAIRGLDNRLKEPISKPIKQEIAINSFLDPFTIKELRTEIDSLTIGKACGLDEFGTKLIKPLGPVAQQWLLALYNNCIETNRIPKIWREAKVMAIPKPSKDHGDPKNFRPISLLCHTYKLLERLILNRLSAYVDNHHIPQQAGFRPGRSCTGQLLSLAELIEEG